jgi:oligopeptide/dipeptide ABC transporter ATP-binding protein
MTLLRVRNLHVHFATDRGFVRAVDGISFDLREGEILGIVGESGSGKSVTALSLMRLVAEDRGRIHADEITLDGVDLLRLSEREMGAVRGAKIGMIFQDPMRSLNPVLTIGRQLTEVLRRHAGLDRRGAARRAVELLAMVGMPAPDKRMDAYPHQLSGGMRQRVMIAIALSCGPRLLIADEATTALDVTIQAQVIELVRRLTREIGTAVIWISHALGVVAGMCDRVNVMYAGRIVETATADDLFYKPAHGYTLSLIRSTPRIDREPEARMRQIDGMPPNMVNPSSLCAFLPRCHLAVDACRHTAPPFRAMGEGHSAACFAELDAAGHDP